MTISSSAMRAFKVGLIVLAVDNLRTILAWVVFFSASETRIRRTLSHSRITSDFLAFFTRFDDVMAIIVDIAKTYQFVIRSFSHLSKSWHKTVTEKVHQGKVHAVDTVHIPGYRGDLEVGGITFYQIQQIMALMLIGPCLLYTSDAADDLTRVD